MSFSLDICNWYLTNKRELPWRVNVNPYNTWISEVILQQTRVNQGLPYYFKFTESFPTVNDLARAEEDEILKIWQGLGYYSRARNMHKTAQEIADKYKGDFPSNYAQLIQLKGIGPYTAAAISSICSNEKVAVVDGNVYRVLARFFNIDLPIDTTEGKKYFNQLANELLTDLPSSIHNQAIMELGALICTPRNTLCNECPLVNQCLGKSLNTYTKLPVKSKKTSVRNRYFNYLILIDSDGKTLLNKRSEKDIWQGLYEFPLLESSEECVLEEAISSFIKNSPIAFSDPLISIGKHPTVFKHKLSHQQLFATFYVIKMEAKIPKNTSDFQTIAISDIQNYPVPQLIQNYLNIEFENLLSLW